jgi:hypothetical protein
MAAIAKPRKPKLESNYPLKQKSEMTTVAFLNTLCSPGRLAISHEMTSVTGNDAD